MYNRLSLSFYHRRFKDKQWRLLPEGGIARCKVLLLVAICLCINLSHAQEHQLDSLKQAYTKNHQDSTLVDVYNYKGYSDSFSSDSAYIFSNKAFLLSRNIHYKRGQINALANLASVQSAIGDLPGSIRAANQVLPQALAMHEFRAAVVCYDTKGVTYVVLNDLKRGLDNFIAALQLATAAHNRDLEALELRNVARAYIDENRFDSAYYFNKQAYNFAIKYGQHIQLGYSIRNFGILEFKRGHIEKAILWYNRCLADSNTSKNLYLKSDVYRRMAEAMQRLHQPDSAIYYSKKSLETAELDKTPDLVQRAAGLMADLFRGKDDYKQAFYYQQIMLRSQDSLFSQQKNQQVQNLIFNEEQRRQEARTTETALKNRVRLYTLLCVITVFALVAAILLYANSRRKKANSVLQQSLDELKKMQQQLIQSEKMASLGELTAGIAHEIQNPLNFVNNFSEVNREILEELKAEIRKPKSEKDEQLEIELINDVIDNEEKISHHGKRADAIVKGMLEHSRASTGQKEPTDMNKLADEYLRLAYHGLRAKDKSFNSELIIHFDESLPLVKVIPQDIGRVLLNLFNNAFYAVNQRQKTAGTDYKPEVSVTTVSENGAVVIRVKDNGNGIPETIKDKIMQPFFTTKPTGEGTGLGLSLSYDIVVKGHGGSINMDSTDGDGAEFTIYLPII